MTYLIKMNNRISFNAKQNSEILLLIIEEEKNEIVLY